MNDVDTMLNAKQTCAASGAGTTMTLWRWGRDPRVQFPPPDAVINNRNYWRASTVRAWQTRMNEQATQARPPAGARTPQRQHAA